MATMLNRLRVAGLAALGLIASLTFAGCDSSNPNPGGGGQTSPPAGGPPQMTGMGPGGPGAGAPQVEDTGPYAAGKKVFRSQNCGRCHPLPGMGPSFAMMGRGGPGGFSGGPGPGGPGGAPPGGPGGAPPAGPGGPPPGGPGGFGGGGPGRPPDLSKLGADPEHTVEWIAEHVRNPKAHKPESRMPAYGEDRINNEDLQALAEFLASLKGDETGDAKKQEEEPKSDDP